MTLARDARFRRSLLPLGALFLLAACKGTTIPDEAPYVAGPIERVLPDGRVHVAGEQGESCGAVVGIGPRTTIRTRAGVPANRSALVAGRRVSVWITGPVMESCPTQVSARYVVLEGE